MNMNLLDKYGELIYDIESTESKLIELKLENKNLVNDIESSMREIYQLENKLFKSNESENEIDKIKQEIKEKQEINNNKYEKYNYNLDIIIKVKHKILWMKNFN